MRSRELALLRVYQDGWRHISPFVTTSVLWSLYSFLKFPDSYMGAVCTAIAGGGDVDTTAAMIGAISGARLGLEGLPAELVCLVHDNATWGYNGLLTLCEHCYTLVCA